MSKQLLIVIDPQNDFTHPKGMYAARHSGISQIVETKARINNLIRAFDSKETVIVQSNYEPDQFGNGLSICGLDTFGHKIDADLRFDRETNIIVKTEHDCFASEEFRKHLSIREVDTLFLCGFLAEYCVKQTALSALRLGYGVFLVEDCIATGDDVQHRREQAFAELKSMGAVLIDSSELSESGSSV